MELINQIINDLVDEEKSLNTALLKTKVLASRIQSKELLEWVNNELTGYKDNKDLPNYRKKIPNYLRGNYINGHNQFTNANIPIDGLDQEIQDWLLKNNIYDSVQSLEKLILEKPSTVASPLSPTIVSLIQSHLQRCGNDYFSLLSVNKIISTNLIVDILSNVKNKLLDFMLKIDNEYGNITEIKDLKMKNEEIKSIVNNTIIQGDGNVLNTGENSKIKNAVKINKSNKTELINALKENGVSQNDINELVEVIDTENPISETNMGQQVNNWIGKMLNKAVDGTWNIGIGAAGGVLVEIIKNYYGI